MIKLSDIHDFLCTQMQGNEQSQDWSGMFDCIREAEIASQNAEHFDECMSQAKKAIWATGEAWRHDWCDFDGRTLLRQCEDIIEILCGQETLDIYLEHWEIDGKTNRWKE